MNYALAPTMANSTIGLKLMELHDAQQKLCEAQGLHPADKGVQQSGCFRMQTWCMLYTLICSVLDLENQQ
jgi:hypothetical protein